MKYLVLILALVSLQCGYPTQIGMRLPTGCDEWVALPMRVELHPLASEHFDGYRKAFTSWDRALGRTAFTWAEDGQPSDVEVVIGEWREHHMATTVHTCVNGHIFTTIRIHRPMGSIESYYFAMHELGHALGVGHSTNEQSVMQPVLYTDLIGENSRDYRITETDARVALGLHP